MHPRFCDKVALIAGGAGEGAAPIALALGEAGAKIALFDRSEDGLQATAALLREQGVEVLVLEGDPSDRGDVRRASEAVVSRFGKVHILVSNAAYAANIPLSAMGKEEWDKAYGVNVGAVVNLLQEFLPIVLRQQEGGHVVARIPVSGLVGGGGDAASAVHAGAVAAIMESLFGELRAQSVGSSLLITSAQPADAVAERAGGIGARVVRGIADGDVFIFADPVPPDTIRNYFARIFDAMPASGGRGGEGPGGNSEEMFPTYVAVLRAKGVMADA